MFKKTGAALDLSTDPEMYQLIENGMRGAVCIISQIYAKPKRSWCGEVNPEQPNTYISELDSKNLYGWAISHLLLWGKFYREGPAVREKIEWQQLREADGFAFIVSVICPTGQNYGKHIMIIPLPANVCTSKSICCPMHSSPSPATTYAPEQQRTSNSSRIS